MTVISESSATPRGGCRSLCAFCDCRHPRDGCDYRVGDCLTHGGSDPLSRGGFDSMTHGGYGRLTHGGFDSPICGYDHLGHDDCEYLSRGGLVRV